MAKKMKKSKKSSLGVLIAVLAVLLFILGIAIYRKDHISFVGVQEVTAVTFPGRPTPVECMIKPPCIEGIRQPDGSILYCDPTPGTVFCTPTPTMYPSGCFLNGKTYKNGESFRSDCNTCTCRKGRIMCTMRACKK